MNSPITPVAVTIWAISLGPNIARSRKKAAMVLIRKIGMSGSSARTCSRTTAANAAGSAAVRISTYICEL